MLRTLAGVVVFVAVLFTIRTGDDCPPKLPADGKCPPGCYVSGDGCTACASGSYNAHKDQSTRCELCDKCDRHEEEVEPCTKISNRNCSCVDGYRWNKDHDGCVRIPTTPTSDRPTIQGITTTTTTTPASSTSCPKPSPTTPCPPGGCNCEKECEQWCRNKASNQTTTETCQECESRGIWKGIAIGVGCCIIIALAVWKRKSIKSFLSNRCSGQRSNDQDEQSSQELDRLPREGNNRDDDEL